MMPEHSRRSFLSRLVAGVAGGALLTAADRTTLQAHAEELAGPERGDDYWRLVKRGFRLEPDLIYLNNASLGPSPALVADATEAFRRTLDAFPSRYMWGGWEGEKEAVRSKAAAFLGADAEEIALIHNTTEGMNLVASSLDLKAGDEVIVADHEHPSGTIPWQYWQEPKGVRLVRPTLPILPDDPGEIVDVYRRAMTRRTRVISMCHVVNTNGMILPVREVSELARQRGVLVAVDGAQAPGMIDVNLADLGCDFYSASSHKWLFSPKGVGVFFARAESQDRLKPLIVAYGWKDGSIRRFENYNTRNLPEVLGLGSALDYQQLIGADDRARRILELKHYVRERLGHDRGLAIKTPGADELSAGITTVEVRGLDAQTVARGLWRGDRIDCRPMTTHGLNGVRISVSIYNSKDEIDLLADSLS
jgi:selenocysteine lyase/cysteine desulfurase